MKNVKTSIQFKLVQGFFGILKVNKMLDKQGADFDKLLEKYAKEQEKELKVPSKLYEKFDVEEKYLNETKYYVVKEKNKIPKKAILYFFGGGYILPPDSGDLVLCGQMAEQCNGEVWFPIYPMAPRHMLIETVRRCTELYQLILERFEPSNIRFFGTSSGGGLALSICQYIVHEKLPISLPQKLVLQSPGLQVPPSKEQKLEMEKLKSKDVMIPPSFLENIAPVLATGDEAYLLSPILFDLTGFPSIDIFYGTNEVMIAYLKDMENVCEKYGVDLNVHIGEGMMHCWGAMEFVPEAKKVRHEYFEALK